MVRPDETSLACPPDEHLSRREWLALGLLALILTVLPYAPEPTLFTSLDWQRIHQFYKEYAAQAVWSGRLPLWNPHVALGRPFLADVDSVLFYPPNVVFLIMPPIIACFPWIAGHMVIGLYGTLRLSRHFGVHRLIGWAAGVTFMASAPIASMFSTGLIHYAAALTYLPLVLHLGLDFQDRPSARAFARLALAMGFQLLSGHPQACWLTILGLALLFLGRRCEQPLGQNFRWLMKDVGLLLAACVAAAAVAGVVLLPLSELSAESNRTEHTLTFAASYAMDLFGWFTALAPMDRHFLVAQNGQLYAGGVVVLAAPLALLPVRTGVSRGLVLLVLVAALLAAGDATPAFRLFYELLPGLASFRIPSRAGVLIALALILAAARFFSTPPSVRFVVPVILLAVGSVLAMAVYAVLLRYDAGSEHATCAVRIFGLHLLLTVLGALGILLWDRARRREDRRWARLALAGLALLTAFDLGRNIAEIKPIARQQENTRNERQLARRLSQEGLLKADAPPPRISSPFSVMENAGMRHGWSSFAGFCSMGLGRVWDYIHEVADVIPSTTQITYPEAQVLRLGPAHYDSMNLVLVQDPGDYRLKRPVPIDLPIDPRVFLAPAAATVLNHHDAIRKMRAGHPFHEIALVEKDVALPARAPADFSAQADILSFAPERLVVRARNSHPALLVLSEAYFPGWQAWIDGRVVENIPVNAWMRGFPVAPGERTIEIRYHSTYLALGGGLSLLALAVLLTLALWKRSPPRPELAGS